MCILLKYDRNIATRGQKTCARQDGRINNTLQPGQPDFVKIQPVQPDFEVLPSWYYPSWTFWKEFWEAYQVLQCAIFCKLKKASLTTTPQQKKYRKNYKKVTQSLSTSYIKSLEVAKSKDLIEEVDRLWSDEWMWWKPISPIFFCLSSKK